jgi:hypothetical protein
MRAIWRKPLIVVGDEDYNVVRNALVVYRKSPFEQFLAQPDLMREKAEVLVSRWQYDLLIDLWVVQLYFRWKGPEDAEVKALRARETDFSLGEEQEFSYLGRNRK